jgi:hypothetical protein
MMARKEAKEKDRRFFGRRRKKEKKVIHYIHIVWPRKKKTRRNEANAAGEMHHVVLHSVCVCISAERKRTSCLFKWNASTQEIVSRKRKKANAKDL